MKGGTVMSRKFSTTILHQTFLKSLSPLVERHSSVEDKPLLVKLKVPYNITLKVYLFNCTNPPGARQAGEWKSQIILPGQQRGQRGKFQIEPGITTLLAGLASITGELEDAIFVLWEVKKHMEFAYSANVQVSLNTLLRVYSEPMFAMKKRGNDEWVVVSRPNHLARAIQKRIKVDIDLLLEG
jgi:hypothetical protein